jgi:hypothetical protein
MEVRAPILIEHSYKKTQIICPLWDAQNIQMIIESLGYNMVSSSAPFGDVVKSVILNFNSNTNDIGLITAELRAAAYTPIFSK